ncbi:hypothetical protein BH10CYA1_BH10CYA1_61980 [soil metagenome]
MSRHSKREPQIIGFNPPKLAGGGSGSGSGSGGGAVGRPLSPGQYVVCKVLGPTSGGYLVQLKHGLRGFLPSEDKFEEGLELYGQLPKLNESIELSEHAQSVSHDNDLVLLSSWWKRCVR